MRHSLFSESLLDPAMRRELHLLDPAMWHLLDPAMLRELLEHSGHRVHAQPMEVVKEIDSRTTLPPESRDALVRPQLPAETSVVIRHSPGVEPVVATEAKRLSATKKV